MATSREREAVKSAYDSITWRKKVDKMSDEQLVAVYQRLRAQNKLKI